MVQLDNLQYANSDHNNLSAIITDLVGDCRKYLPMLARTVAN